jgi:hypothetical protein
MRRAARTDANHAVIVGALLRCGATVQSLAAVGQGCPDLMVGFRGRTLLMEVKDGDKIPSKRRLTPDQQEWHAAWAGHVVVVESVEQAIAALLAHRPAATMETRTEGT